MTKKVHIILAAILMAGTFSSCFEVVEEMNLNQDGSGKVTLTVNMSQSRSRLASIMLLDSIQGHKVPSEADIRKSLQESAAFLKASEGISDVSYNLNMDDFIASISFAFEEVSDVNRLTEAILKKHKIETSGVSSFRYEPATRQFTRSYRHDPKGRQEYMKLKEADRSVFREATYTNIYRFPSTIQSSANQQTRISGSRKAVMLQCSVEDLVSGKIDIGNRIVLND